MAKLTDEGDWNYQDYSPPSTEHFEYITSKEDTWISTARKHLPSGGSFIELGCAPGYCSAAVTYQRPDLGLTGIDFSASAESYLTTLKSVGRPDAKLIKENLFAYKGREQYDVVTSFGLIEHFTAFDLEKMLTLHDQLLAPGGTLMIEVPNFNGLQRLWHAVFDRPTYLQHNIRTMRPATFDFFREKNYREVYCDYVGNLELWGDSGAYKMGPTVSKFTARLEYTINQFSSKRTSEGRPLKGRMFSPALIYIAQKPRAE
jgi:2-polyprenyl-3-methyl-5-hydroxy-6-metoxy-1,4-benzoquinol methylase